MDRAFPAATSNGLPSTRLCTRWSAADWQPMRMPRTAGGTRQRRAIAGHNQGRGRRYLVFSRIRKGTPRNTPPCGKWRRSLSESGSNPAGRGIGYLSPRVNYATASCSSQHYCAEVRRLNLPGGAPNDFIQNPEEASIVRQAGIAARLRVGKSAHQIVAVVVVGRNQGVGLIQPRTRRPRVGRPLFRRR